MKVEIQHQDSYSRLELLLRTFFGFIYIGIPHTILLVLYTIWTLILMVYAWFSILFTKNYPKISFEAYTGLMRWQLRVNASLLNLVDGYPPFGPDAEWDKVNMSIGYPERISRTWLLFVTFLGWIVLIPHFIILYVIAIAIYILYIINFFIVLFTGNYPENLHSIFVGFYRWAYRINLFLGFLYLNYPDFSLEETDNDKSHSS